MDFEERRQEEHTVRQILSEDSGETSRQRLDIDPSLSAGSEQGESSFDEKTVEYNMNITIDIVEADYQEVENEFVDSIVESFSLLEVWQNMQVERWFNEAH